MEQEKCLWNFWYFVGETPKVPFSALDFPRKKLGMYDRYGQRPEETRSPETRANTRNWENFLEPVQEERITAGISSDP